MMALLSASSHAEVLPEWFYKAIKVETPNQLSYYVTSSVACPFTTEALSEIVDGVLIRSRIKPLKNNFFISKKIYLNLSVECLQLKSVNNLVFNIRANFARYSPKPAIIFDHGFGTIGIGGQEYIKRTFKESVENAVTAHVKANFDL